MKNLKAKTRKKSSFLCLCYILRAIRAGRCRERRYADHIFIQIYFSKLMHHFVAKFSKKNSPQAAREHWPPNLNPADVPEYAESVIKRSSVRPSVRISVMSIDDSTGGRRVCCWGRARAALQILIDSCCRRATCGPRKFRSDCCKEVRHTCLRLLPQLLFPPTAFIVHA